MYIQGLREGKGTSEGERPRRKQSSSLNLGEGRGPGDEAARNLKYSESPGR